MFAALRAEMAALQQRRRAELCARDGGIAHFLRSLDVIDIAHCADSLLVPFYSLYEQVFTLEAEREPYAGFVRVLALNADAGVQAAFGPLAEQITVACDPATGQVVGAVNWVRYGYTPGFRLLHGYGASCQINFICVDPGYRDIGIASMLLDAVEKKLADFARAQHAGEPARALITCEQNNPARMTDAQIVQDANAALIDAAARTAWWYRRGYRRLAFPYVQPPLAAGAVVCDYLDLYGHTVPHLPVAASLPAPLLFEHLRRFFYVSVGKCAVEMAEDAAWRTQSDMLLDGGQVAFAD